MKKRIIIFMISALLALSLTACGTTPSSPTKAKDADGKETSSAGADTESDGAEQTTDPLGGGQILPEIPIE